MPPRNIIKVYSQDGYYHIYNRGVGKRRIFKEKSDYLTFLSFLKEALSEPVDPDLLKETFTLQGCSFQGVPHQPKNFHNKLYLLAFCLMPNHFHLLVRQINPIYSSQSPKELQGLNEGVFVICGLSASEKDRMGKNRYNSELF